MTKTDKSDLEIVLKDAASIAAAVAAAVVAGPGHAAAVAAVVATTAVARDGATLAVRANAIAAQARLAVAAEVAAGLGVMGESHPHQAAATWFQIKKFLVR